MSTFQPLQTFAATPEVCISAIAHDLLMTWAKHTRHLSSSRAMLEALVTYAINVVLMVGFIILDWLRFHDILKPEVPTGADWLTGALSLLVFYVVLKSLLTVQGRTTAA